MCLAYLCVCTEGVRARGSDGGEKAALALLN